jgi:hypothetical protein
MSVQEGARAPSQKIRAERCAEFLGGLRRAGAVSFDAPGTIGRDDEPPEAQDFAFQACVSSDGELAAPA